MQTPPGRTPASPNGHGERVRYKVVRRVKKRRHPVRRWLTRIGWALAAIVVLLAIDTAWSAMTLRRALPIVRTNLSAGAEALVAGNLQGAAGAFQAADNAAGDAVGAATHPGMRVAALLPWIGDDAHAVRSLAEASQLAARAGDTLVIAAQDAGWDGKGLPGYQKGGSFDTAPIEAASAGLARAAALITRANDLLAPISTDGLIGSVRDAVKKGKAQVVERAALATKMSSLAKFLPTLLGADGPKTWLVVMMSPSDPRGAGGYPGEYGLLHTNDGKVSFSNLAAVGDLPVLPESRAVDAPADVRRRYASLGATTHFIATTYSPDFPTDARLMLGIWNAGGGSHVDGVIAADPTWMSYLLDALGPVDNPVHDPGFPATITAANVREVVGKDTYMTTDGSLSNEWQASIGSAVWREMFSRPWPLDPIASAVTRATDERHLMMYASDPAQQSLLEDLGAAGTVRLTEDPPLVTFNGYVPNRAFYFAKPSITSDVVVNPDGSKSFTVKVTIENDAPATPDSILLGSDHPGVAYNYPVGAIGVQVAVYLPIGATNIQSTTKPAGSVEAVEEEFGHPVATNIMHANPGQTSVAVFTYTVPAKPQP